MTPTTLELSYVQMSLYAFVTVDIRNRIMLRTNRVISQRCSLLHDTRHNWTRVVAVLYVYEVSKAHLCLRSLNLGCNFSRCHLGTAYA